MEIVGGKLVDYLDEHHEAWIEALVQSRLGREWAKHVDPEEEA